MRRVQKGDVISLYLKTRILFKMMKIQRDGISCGPVALINAYYYKHGTYPKMTTRTLMRKCSTDDKVGTHRWNMMDCEIVRLGKPTYNLNKIKGFDACILLYSFGKKYAHYVFVVRKCGGYKIYNYCDEDSDDYEHVTMTEEEYSDMLRANPRVEGLDYPLAWCIAS